MPRTTPRAAAHWISSAPRRPESAACWTASRAISSQWHRSWPGCTTSFRWPRTRVAASPACEQALRIWMTCSTACRPVACTSWPPGRRWARPRWRRTLLSTWRWLQACRWRSSALK
ncbi:hypothetical protein G6F45_014003 [Rhizopus arrhizus]|nr:hypothetical protein G6F45_014003 [Rhizopus arrhizus]